MNVLKPHLRTTIATLLERGVSQCEIQRRTGVDRKTIRRYARAAKIPTLATGSDPQAPGNAPPWPPGPGWPAAAAGAPPAGGRAAAGGSVSACEPHREWIERQVQRGRNAVSLYQ